MFNVLKNEPAETVTEAGAILVRSAHDGDGRPPWEPDGHTVYRYRITAAIGGADGPTYGTSGWGSIADADAGRVNSGGMVDCVLSDLYSAAMDPDEFVQLATEGRAYGSAARLRQLSELLAFAEQHADAIQAAYEAFRAWEDDGGTLETER